jgi:hypothetical protein
MPQCNKQHAPRGTIFESRTRAPSLRVLVLVRRRRRHLARAKLRELHHHLQPNKANQSIGSSQASCTPANYAPDFSSSTSDIGDFVFSLHTSLQQCLKLQRQARRHGVEVSQSMHLILGLSLTPLVIIAGGADW